MFRRLVPVLALIVACSGASKPPDTSPTTTNATNTTTTNTTTPPAPVKKRLVLVDAEGVGLGGHDPVAYVKDGAAVKGAAAQVSEHDGAKYRFSSAEHKATFDADKAKHAPQYGGYCAYAASLNRVSEADPTVWQIVDGQLLVFTDRSYKLQFNADVAGNKAKADANWPGLVEKYGK